MASSAPSDDAPTAKRDNWRDKYKNGAGAGREQTCQLIAGYWHQMLKSMADQIKTAGAEPWIDPDALMPSMVLTLDEVLPEDMQLTPRATALLGTTAITAQRFLLRGKIREMAEYGAPTPTPAYPPPPAPPAEPEPVAAQPPLRIVPDDAAVLEWREQDRPLL